MLRIPEKGDKIAFVMSQRIGDTLISMVMVQNLVRHGFQITVYSAHLTALHDWFPGYDIHPAIAGEHARAVLEEFDIVIHAYRKDAVGDTLDWHPQAWVMNEWPIYLTLKPMIAIQRDVCRDLFGIADANDDNGIVLPPCTPDDIVAHRVVIHPTASLPAKQWLPQRFLRLAKRLRRRGHQVCFVVAPGERQAWAWVEAEGYELVTHATLHQLARWLMQAGLLIGNDSGIAHLASNVGVPTISLATRRKIALRWKPGWAPSIALTPMSIVPGGRAREALWKHLLPVFKVMRAVDRLARVVAATPRAFGPLPARAGASAATGISTGLIASTSDLQTCNTVPTNDATAATAPPAQPVQAAACGARNAD